MSTNPVSPAESERKAFPPSWARLRRMQQIHALGVIGIPLAGVLIAIYFAFQYSVSPAAIGLLLCGHALSMIGICAGFHRYFAHPGFKAPRWLAHLLCGLGSTAGQGPMIFWVATHRRHHRFSDKEGDPHSPQLGRSLLRRFWHAHIGWMFSEMPSNPVKYAPDLLKDPILRGYSGEYYFWLAGGWILPGLILFAMHATPYSFMEGVLWGGLVRTFVVQHATWSVNSICHLYGTADHEIRDKSRNNLLLSYLTFGESWHNNHHAFPLSALHGHKWWQFDPAGIVIRMLATLGWIHDLKLPKTMQAEREIKT